MIWILIVCLAWGMLSQQYLAYQSCVPTVWFSYLCRVSGAIVWQLCNFSVWDSCLSCCGSIFLVLVNLPDVENFSWSLIFQTYKEDLRLSLELWLPCLSELGQVCWVCPACVQRFAGTVWGPNLLDLLPILHPAIWFPDIFSSFTGPVPSLLSL